MTSLHIIPDYEVHAIDIRCYCNGQGNAFHNQSVRCGVCQFCGERILGIWFNDHEDNCWAKQQAKELLRQQARQLLGVCTGVCTGTALAQASGVPVDVALRILDKLVGLGKLQSSNGSYYR